MSDEKKYTERDMALATREAMENGAVRFAHRNCCYAGRPLTLPEIRREIASAIPLPEVTRPRVVKVSGINRPWVAYRLCSAALQSQECLDACCPHDIRWENVESIPTHHIRAVADLLANPTEEVEAEP